MPYIDEEDFDRFIEIENLPAGVRKGLEKAIQISKGCATVKGTVTYHGVVLPKKAICQIEASRQLKEKPLPEIDFKKLKKRL